MAQKKNSGKASKKNSGKASKKNSGKASKKNTEVVATLPKKTEAKKTEAKKTEIGVVDGVKYDNARRASLALWKNGEGMSVADMTKAINAAGIKVSYQTVGSYTVYAEKVHENKMKRKVFSMAHAGLSSANMISAKTGINANAIRAMVKNEKIEIPSQADIDKRAKDAAEAKAQKVAAANAEKEAARDAKKAVKVAAKKEAAKANAADKKEETVATDK